MRPARRHACVLLLIGALAGCASAPPAPPMSTGLTGKWSPMTAELGGKPFPLATLQGPLLITGESFEFAKDKGRYTVVSSSKPAKIDIHGVEGPNAGRQIPAIFELKGNELVVCYQLGGGNRPTDFVSPAGTRVLLMRYKRIQ